MAWLGGMSYMSLCVPLIVNSLADDVDFYAYVAGFLPVYMSKPAWGTDDEGRPAKTLRQRFWRYGRQAFESAFQVALIPFVTTSKWTSNLYFDLPQTALDGLFLLMVDNRTRIVWFTMLFGVLKIAAIWLVRPYVTQRVEERGTPKQLCDFERLHGPNNFTDHQSAMHLVADAHNRPYDRPVLDAVCSDLERLGETALIEDENKSTPLHVACRTGNIHFVSRIAEEHPELLQKAVRLPHNDWFLLGLAASILNLELCRKLIENGAQPQNGTLGTADVPQCSALMIAVRELVRRGNELTSGQKELLKLLADRLDWHAESISFVDADGQVVNMSFLEYDLQFRYAFSAAIDSNFGWPGKVWALGQTHGGVLVDLKEKRTQFFEDLKRDGLLEGDLEALGWYLEVQAHVATCQNKNCQRKVAFNTRTCDYKQFQTCCGKCIEGRHGAQCELAKQKLDEHHALS
jgi:hypothetical protein